MLVEVELRAFRNDTGQIRNVELPNLLYLPSRFAIENDEESRMFVLEKIWMYGQNDFQPKQQRSVSVGDVVRLYDRKFEVAMLGFEEIK